jgi:hypothetical protein
MKNKKAIILAMLLFVFIAGSIYSINKQHGNTVEARQIILSKRDNHVIILREIIIENSIISEMIDQESGYGYAQFEKNKKENYILKTKMVRTRQDEPILTDTIVINDEVYEILMCNTSGLEYAEVIYTDDTTGKKGDPIRVEMHNQTVALIKAPEYSSYTRSAVFYNYKGDRFE